MEHNKIGNRRNLNIGICVRRLHYKFDQFISNTYISKFKYNYLIVNQSLKLLKSNSS